MNRRLTVLLSLLALSVAAAIGSSVPSPRERARRQAARNAALNEWLADSLAYGQILDKWLQDSTVIDSIATTIPTDSLRRLYRAAKDAPNPAAIVQAISCETGRLQTRYGYSPSLWAIQAAQKATLTPDESRAIDSRLPERMVFDDDACGDTLRRPLTRVGETELTLRPESRPVLRPRP